MVMTRRIFGRVAVSLPAAVAGCLVSFAVLAVMASTASAVYPQDSVTVYTGCLTTGGSSSGNINNVTAGLVPLKPCNSNQKVVHLSGGTITSINAGTGLSGGGSNGSTTLSLASSYALPQSCTDGQIIKWNATNNVWGCANDQTYTNGTGLDLTGNTFSINSSYRLPQSCTNGQVPASDGSGGWTCVTPKTYSGSDFAKSNQSCNSGDFVDGIDSSGTVQCSPDQTYDGSTFALSNHSCPTGEFQTGVSSTGTPVCSTPPLPDVYHSGSTTSTSNGTTDTTTTITSVTVPAGSYSFTAAVQVINDDSSNDSSGFCWIEAGGTTHDSTGYVLTSSAGDNADDSIPLVDAFSVGSTTTINVQCTLATNTASASLNAQKVGTVH